MEIENAQLDDSAHYRCSATNYLGRASSAARVRVNLAEEEEGKIRRKITFTFKLLKGQSSNNAVGLICLRDGSCFRA